MKKKLRLLDLFCCAGGAGMGYSRAGFEVVGVDIKPQPRYPFEFHQADAMTFPLDGFDVIHASPPCQSYSAATPERTKQNHPDLLAPTRKRLQETGKPYIIENVVGAPMRADFGLCGCHFDLPHLRRKRLFETNWSGLYLMPPCQHDDDICITVTGNHTMHIHGSEWAGHRNRRGVPPGMAEAAMGIDWMTVKELSQAIPPAYTEFIGNQLLQKIERVHAYGTELRVVNE